MARDPEAVKRAKANYRARNREKLRQKAREYDAKNAEAIKEYRQRTRARKEAYDRQYRKDNLEKIREKNRKYYRDHVPEYIARLQKRNAAVRSSTTEDCSELKEIKQFYIECPAGYHVDHIVPIALGGRHELANLQWLEASLNLSKHAKHPDDWNDPRPISCRG
jgi:5-methylcytosine-specific restriction endonuclease McrA